MGEVGALPGPGAPIGRADGWSLCVLARVLAGAGGKLGARVARQAPKAVLGAVSSVAGCGVGGRGEGGGRREPRASLSGPAPTSATPPGLWLLRAESDFPSGSFLGAPQRGGVPSGCARALRGAPGRARPGAKGRPLRDKDRLRGDALGWCAEEEGRPGLRGAGGLVPVGPGLGPGKPRPEGCLGRRSAAMAVPGGFCSWSLRKMRKEGKETKDRQFQNLLGTEPESCILRGG